MKYRTDLRILETMGGAYAIFGPRDSAAYTRPALTAFEYWPYDRTDSRRRAEKELQRLQILEDRSLLGDSDYT